MRDPEPDQESCPIISWRIQPDERGMRLDAFLRKQLPHLSLRQLRRALQEGAFCVNSKAGKKGVCLSVGDRISCRDPAGLLSEEPPPRRASNVVIVYEDEAILVVEKPAGMPTHGFSGKEMESLANHLVAERPELRHVGTNRWEPGLVHRLDRETSGLMIVAKDKAAFADLREQFHAGLVKKKYWALLWGRVPREGSIDYPLVHDSRDRRKMRALVERAGRSRVKRWPALTQYRTASCRNGFSLVEISMVTGVTHQIRVHVAAIGHPLVGDSLYGGGSPLVKRQFLHASHISCRHPRSGAAMSWESPLPQELKETLSALGIATK